MILGEGMTNPAGLRRIVVEEERYGGDETGVHQAEGEVRRSPAEADRRVGTEKVGYGSKPIGISNALTDLNARKNYLISQLKVKEEEEVDTTCTKLTGK